MPSRLSIAIASLLFLAALTAALVFFLRPADAAPFAVTKTADTNDGSCDVVDCSLREAIIAANLAPGADTITLPAGIYTLTITGQDEDLSATGDLDITEGLSITGDGAASTIIQACDSSIGDCTAVDRVFHIRSASGAVSVSGVTIQNGRGPSPSNGGGIYNELAGTVAITDSTIRSNIATFGGGLYTIGDLTLTGSTVSENFGNGGNAGGILAGGTLTITNSTVSDNVAAGSGGGIFNNGTVTITSSTVSDNATAGSNGGAGIFNQGTATITNSTVSGNLAGGSGGGILNWSLGTATITNSTITNNTSDRDAEGSGVGDGGGIANSGGGVNVKDTIIAGNHDLSNTTVEPDCFGTLTSQGYNLIETVSAGCIITGDTATNVTGQSANLGPLALNAPGTTETHALLADSPAIDAGSPNCPPPAADQRGVARPLGNACDIGAYESSFSGPTPVPTPSPVPTPTPSPTPSPTPTSTATTSPATATPTDTPPATATPTVTVTASPTATPSPTASGPPLTATPTPQGETRLWGDSDCNEEVNIRDSQAVLRNVLDQPPLSQQAGCPELGEAVVIGSASRIWGDWDCEGDIRIRDSQALLRRVLSQPALSQTEPCPDIGSSVVII